MKAAGRLALLFALVASTASAAEFIRDFSSEIAVAASGKLRVTETVRIHTEGHQVKHGIYRDFPTIYSRHWGLRSTTSFDVLRVTRDGADEPWHTETLSNGLRLYIGAGDFLVPAGDHDYGITYETTRQLGFFPDHDELYWNSTGNGWIFPIEHATAHVTLPAGANITRHEAYTGPNGARGGDYATHFNPAAPTEITFTTTKRLSHHEGFTIVVAWPTGIVTPGRGPLHPLVLLQSNPGLGVALAGLVIVFAYYFVVWVRVGRDPKAGTIIPLYAPPAGFSPAAVRMVQRMGYDQKCFVANLVGLAVKDALKIRQEEETISISRQNEHASLLADEALLRDKLFATGATLVFERDNYVRIREAQDALRRHLTTCLAKAYFLRNVGHWLVGLGLSIVPVAAALWDMKATGPAIFVPVWLAIWTLGVVAIVRQAVANYRAGKISAGVGRSLFALPFVAGEVLGLGVLATVTSVWVVAIFAATIALNLIFFHLLKAPTRLGRSLLDQIEGFKRYLTIAEKDRLNLENPPSRTPALFDRFLPFALALGVEQQWAEQFSDVLSRIGAPGNAAGYAPDWYAGPALTATSFPDFGGSLTESVSAAVSASSSPPGSGSGFSDSGGGGSDSGGSSGGGGGGGGGGGW